MSQKKIHYIIENIYSGVKKTSHKIPVIIEPYCRRVIRFLALPYCFFFLVNWNQCTVSRTQVIKDLLYIFFRLKYFPDNYSACRLFEKQREDWSYYYGSNYDPYQRSRLRSRIQPVEFEILFEDKEICMNLCAGGNLPTPRTFGVIDPKEEYISDLKNIFRNNNIVEVIIKPVRGSAGKGVVKGFSDGNKIMIRDKDNIVRVEMYVLQERALVQEVVSQDLKISKVSEKSINTIRVLTLMANSKEVLLVGATMRFGVGDSYIDNWSAGGIAVGVDVSNGTLKGTAFDKLGNQYRMHPVSNVEFQGFKIPKWEEVKKLSQKVQHQFPYYKLIGIDIAITEDIPVILEINASPDFVFQEQTSGPLLADRRIYSEFKSYDLLINKYQKYLWE